MNRSFLMHRLQALGTTITSVLISATSLNADPTARPQSDETSPSPNVVTLLVDDLGYRDLGCFGGPVKTPVLDKLAAEGVRFTDFHSGAPSCSPSRATFLTGRCHPPERHGRSPGMAHS